MILTRTVEIRHHHGLHARPAAEIAKIAAAHQGEVYMLVGEKQINLKSMVSIMAAAVKGGQVATLQVSGEGAATTLQRLADYLEHGGVA